MLFIQQKQKHKIAISLIHNDKEHLCYHASAYPSLEQIQDSCVPLLSVLSALYSNKLLYK